MVIYGDLWWSMVIFHTFFEQPPAVWLGILCCQNGDFLLVPEIKICSGVSWPRFPKPCVSHGFKMFQYVSVVSRWFGVAPFFRNCQWELGSRWYAPAHSLSVGLPKLGLQRLHQPWVGGVSHSETCSAVYFTRTFFYTVYNHPVVDGRSPFQSYSHNSVFWAIQSPGWLHNKRNATSPGHSLELIWQQNIYLWIYDKRYENQ